MGKNEEKVDKNLAELALEGNNNALNTLINRHKDFIYNLAFRMLGNMEDAKDVTQEIWVKVVTKLSTFNFESSFKTWLYRITVNHILNVKKSKHEQLFTSFESHDRVIRGLKDEEISAPYAVDEKLVIEETRVQCMTGMLLCLTREQRIVFILGSIFGINSQSGGEILHLSPENFRKQLSRARQQLLNYMNGKCSLINPGAPCNCKRKTQAAIRKGIVDPGNLKFTPKYMKKVQDMAEKNTNDIVENILEMKCQQKYQQHPYLILENEVLKSVKL